LINLTKKIAIQALDSSAQALVVVNAHKRGLPVVYVNTAFETLTGLEAGHIIGGRLDELVVDGQLPGRSGEWSSEGDEDCEQSWRSKADGELRLNVRRTPLFDRPGKPSFWLLTALGLAGAESTDGEAALRDALHDARRKLKRLERTDTVTGVPNEGAFGELLQRDWGIARREQRRLGIAIFEVDYLEEYREKLGRHATDSVLRKVAHAVNGSLRRAGDFGARVGDDRFAVVLGSANETQARDFAERAVRKVSNLAIPHPRSPRARNITISYGTAAEVPEWTSTCNALLETAEQRLAESQAEAAASADDADDEQGNTRRAG